MKTKIERLERRLRSLFDSEEEYQAHCQQPLWQRIGFKSEAEWNAHCRRQRARLWRAAARALTSSA
jgi:hypothetical protein